MVIRGPTGEKIFYVQRALLNELIGNPTLMQALINHENVEQALIDQGLTGEEAHAVVVGEREIASIVDFASSPRNDIYRAIINKEFIAQQKDLMRAAEGVVLKTFISNTKTHLEAGEFKGAVAQLANAVSGAKLLDKREQVRTGNKDYRENEIETVRNIIEALIVSRDELRGKEVMRHITENILERKDLSYILDIALYLIKDKAKSVTPEGLKPEILRQKVGEIINSSLEEATVRYIVDRQFRNFAKYIMNPDTPFAEKMRLLRAVNLGPFKLFFTVFFKAESPEKTILYSLDGRTVNSIHCAVVLAASMLNDERVREYLAGKDITIKKEVTLEGLAEDFSKNIIAKVEEAARKDGKSIQDIDAGFSEIRGILSNLKAGLISYSPAF